MYKLLHGKKYREQTSSNSDSDDSVSDKIIETMTTSYGSSDNISDDDNDVIPTD